MQTDFAMHCLQAAMNWDELVYGRVYDLVSTAANRWLLPQLQCKWTICTSVSISLWQVHQLTCDQLRSLCLCLAALYMHAAAYHLTCACSLVLTLAASVSHGWC